MSNWTLIAALLAFTLGPVGLAVAQSDTTSSTSIRVTAPSQSVQQIRNITRAISEPVKALEAAAAATDGGEESQGTGGSPAEE